MSNHSRRALKRTGAAIIAALAGATSVALVPGTAGALPGFEFDRIAGGDRFATAADIALTAFPGGATDAILATGEAFPDALAGNYLAGALGAPLLLARHDDVPDVTMDALDDLGASTVTLLGGTQALDDGVAAELSAAGYTVDRISGIDRYDTAKLIATQGAPLGIGTVDGKETAIITTGENFPDALAAGPVAYDESFPVLLTPGGALSPRAAEAIDELNIEHAIILGGTAAISTAAENTLGAMGLTTERIEGANRFATAAAIADRAVADFGFGVGHVNVAFGRNFPDALAGGPLGGEEASVTLLTDSDEATTETCAWLEGHADTLATGHALGGTNAIGTGVLAELRQCAGGEAPNQTPRANQDFNSSPSTPVLGVLGSDAIARQEYTFSDILPGTKVDITFVPCFAQAIALEGNDAGTIEFADDPIPRDFFFDLLNGENDDAVTQADYLGLGHGLYILGLDNTAIVFVNGEVPGDDHYVDDFVVPASGQVVVEYFSVQSDCVIPLIFDDTPGDDTLNLEPDTNLPVDEFAVGGAFIASNGEAASGQEIDGNVMFNNADEGYFVLDDDDTPIVDGNVFFYEETDQFLMEGNFPPFFPSSDFALSHAEWQTSLSPLDEIDDDSGGDQDYSRSAGNVFEVDDDTAGTVRGVSAVMGDFDDIPADTTLNDARVTWDTPDPTWAWITDYEVDIYDGNGVFLGAVEFDSDDDPEPDTVPEANQDVDNDNIDDDVDNEIIFEDLPLSPSGFQFVVYALTATGDESLFGSEPSNIVFSPGSPGAPLALSTIFVDALAIINPLGVIGTGDIFQVTFDQQVFCGAGSSITFQDGDGTTGRVVFGVNSNWAGCGTNTLTITLTANPILIGSGADGIQQVPSDIVSSVNIFNAVLSAWNIIDSPDVTIA